MTDPDPLGSLTPRQREAIEAVVREGGIAEAARALYVEPTSVRSRLSDAYRRAGVPNGMLACYLLGRAHERAARGGGADACRLVAGEGAEG